MIDFSVTPLFLILSLIICLSAAVIFLRKRFLICSFFILCVINLLIMQGLYLHFAWDSYPISPLDSYGYNTESETVIALSIMLLSFLFLFYSTRKVSTNQKSNDLNYPFISRRIILIFFFIISCVVYISVVGIENFKESRPNQMPGSAISLTLILAVSLASYTLMYDPRQSSFILLILIFLIANFMFIIGGTRSFSVFSCISFFIIFYDRFSNYYWYFIFIAGVIFIMIMVTLALVFFAFNVFNLNDSFFNHLFNALSGLYSTQIEAFSGSASALELYFQGFRGSISYGLDIVESLSTFLPRELRSYFDFTLFDFGFNSIVPSGLESFISSFGMTGIPLFIAACASVYYAESLLLKYSEVHGRLVYTFFVPLAVIYAFILVRGPLGVLFFLVIPYIIISSVFYYFSSRIEGDS